MPTLILRFPGGRYHATPPGHHVNEGALEWPPSPWRIVRALIATGYTTQHWEEVPPGARRLVEALSGSLPRYRLPEASVAHSRHYMPTAVFDKGREKTTLVYDSWASVGDGAIAVRWDCELDAEASEIFSVLARHLAYLGRSESWVEAELVDDGQPLPRGTDAYPVEDEVGVSAGWEQLSVMAPQPAAHYAVWRARAVEEALAQHPAPPGKRLTKALEKARDKALQPYPQDLIDCLCRDTAWWKGQQWSAPPGSRRVLYLRRNDALTVGAPMSPRIAEPAPVTTTLLAFTTPSGNLSSLPLTERTLPQAERFHRALVRLACGEERTHCPEVTGKDREGRPLLGHQHAHLLPVDLDGDGRLDHLILHVPMGLGPNAQEAVRRLRRTWMKGGASELQVAVAGQGSVDDLRGLPGALGDGLTKVLGPRGGARVWRSVTPFVAPRFQKPRGTNTLEGQVLREVQYRGLPPATVEILPWDDETRRLRHAVRVRRPPAAPPPVDAGYALRLVFAEPLSGPLSLGYGSHYGLGLFAHEGA